MFTYGRLRAYFREVVDAGEMVIDGCVRNGSFDLSGSQLGRAFTRAKLVRMHCDVGARIFVPIGPRERGRAERTFKDNFFVSGWSYDLYRAFEVVTDALKAEDVDLEATLGAVSPRVLFFKDGRRLYKGDRLTETEEVLFVLLRILRPLTELKEQYDALLVKLAYINERRRGMGLVELTP